MTGPTSSRPGPCSVFGPWESFPTTRPSRCSTPWRSGTDDDYLLVLQHPHVFTLGAHADPSHVLTDPASVGATLEQTDRGGDVDLPRSRTACGLPDRLGAGRLVGGAGARPPPRAGRHRHVGRHRVARSDAVWTGTQACGSTPTARHRGRSPPSACAPCAALRARGARCTAWPSTSSVTSPCSVTSFRAALPTGR